MLPYIRCLVFPAAIVAMGLPAIAPAQSGSGPGEFRQFHDAEGRAIQARVLGIGGDEVTIERRDGRLFTVPISIFSQADQNFIRGLAGSKVQFPAKGAWPRFRGPTGMGTADATSLPLVWDQTRGVAWKTPLPGPGASSPIVYDQRVYVTCYTGYFVPGESGGSPEQLKRHLIAVRLADGRILWDKAVAARLPEEKQIREHGYAASTPAADAERVYVFFGKSGVFAFDHEGKQLWQADVGSKTSGWGSAASPVVYKDMVFINASVESESLVALDRQTGREKWRAGGIRESWNTPVVITAPSGRQELIVAVQGRVLAFDPDSGQALWSCQTDIAWYMVPSLVATDGVVYCLGGRSGTAALAVRAGGSGDVTDTHRLWTSQKGSNVSSPVYFDGHLYWMHESLGIAYCAQAASGQLVYEQRLERAGQVYASALLAGGRLYYVARHGKTFVLAAKPRFEQLAVNDLSDGGVFNASPAVAGDHLLLRSDKYLYCVANEHRPTDRPLSGDHTPDAALDETITPVP